MAVVFAKKTAPSGTVFKFLFTPRIDLVDDSV